MLRQYSRPHFRKGTNLESIGAADYVTMLFAFLQVIEYAYESCYICTLSFVGSIVLSGLLMILNLRIQTREGMKSTLVLAFQKILLIGAFLSCVPIVFPFMNVMLKQWMLFILWFIYLASYYEEVLSIINRAKIPFSIGARERHMKNRSLGIGLTEHTDNPTTENGSYHHVISMPIGTTTHTLPDHTGTVMRPLDQNDSNFRTSYIEKKRLDREEVMGENTGIFQAPPMTESTYPESKLTTIATAESQQTLQVNCQHQSKQPRERRGPKGYPTKPVCQSKINTLWRDVFSCSKKKRKEYVFEKEDNVFDKKDSKFCSITYGQLCSLIPGGWLCDDVIDIYAKLLISRPSTKDSYVLPVHFLNIIKADAKAWLRKKAKKHNTERQEIWSYMEWNGQGSIAGKDTIFIPVHVRSNHFVLFVFYVKRWELILLDPMFDDTPSMSHSHSYQKEIAILGKYFAHMLRSYAPNMTFKKGPASFHTYQKRPKQRNGSDCGVYVLKYMDYMLRGISLENQEWSYHDALIFRYRIALEILKRKARP